MKKPAKRLCAGLLAASLVGAGSLSTAAADQPGNQGNGSGNAPGQQNGEEENDNGNGNNNAGGPPSDITPGPPIAPMESHLDRIEDNVAEIEEAISTYFDIELGEDLEDEEAEEDESAEEDEEAEEDESADEDEEAEEDESAEEDEEAEEDESADEDEEAEEDESADEDEEAEEDESADEDEEAEEDEFAEEDEEAEESVEAADVDEDVEEDESVEEDEEVEEDESAEEDEEVEEDESAEEDKEAEEDESAEEDEEAEEDESAEEDEEVEEDESAEEDEEAEEDEDLDEELAEWENASFNSFPGRLNAQSNQLGSIEQRLSVRANHPHADGEDEAGAEVQERVDALAERIAAAEAAVQEAQEQWTSGLDEEEADERTSEESVAVDHAWNVAFSAPLNEDTVANENFLLIDEDRDVVEVDVSYDAEAQAVTLDPVDNFYEDETYDLYIRGDVEDESGTPLGSTTRMNFTVE
ncbi:Ig-like domain-containing protein [Salsuginibacillus halophilus]|uniref:Ig-like domain-containing protein n=1 Tax=Salsuginibacillus halophilus TaxID=517424 RepID=A0A2P8HQA6_9BACI|nr:Ig-like domain-containing protein [Salsuginibacillus halophilus]PSL48420.1 Ig-like domain-containing protein [Salsuginibacillus halophilus]